MQGSAPQDNRARRQRIWRAAATAVALGAVLLLTSAVWDAEPGYGILVDLTRLSGSVAILVSIVLVLYERLLHQWWVDELAQLSGPGVLASLLPAHVMGTLLAQLYGDSPANHDVVHGVLGGEGSQPRGQDLSISTNTSVHYELRSQVPGTYELVSTVRFSFRTGLNDSKLIIFATCDPRLRDVIAAGCDRPMFDWWYVPDQEIFAESVAGMLRSAEVGFHYRDMAGEPHEVALAKVEPRYVPFDEWHRYLTFFREATGALPRQNPGHYIGTLRIYECDLADVEDPAHPIECVEGLTTRIVTLQSTDDGYCYWQPPYPCFVDEITFDVAGLGSEDGTRYLFRIAPFVLRAGSVPTSWARAQELPAVPVRSWVLPGHGFALLWRSLPEAAPSEIDDP